jgi:hypothetical protein
MAIRAPRPNLAMQCRSFSMTSCALHSFRIRESLRRYALNIALAIDRAPTLFHRRLAKLIAAEPNAGVRPE